MCDGGKGSSAFEVGRGRNHANSYKRIKDECEWLALLKFGHHLRIKLLNMDIQRPE
jgi:hypothetical protein